MGDRAHIHLHYGDQPGVYLYTHNNGSNLPEIVQRGLMRGHSRWGDVAYLNRIIFSVLVEEDLKGTTNYGLDAQAMDTGDGGRVVDVDHDLERITLRGSLFDPVSYTFAEYINLGQEQVQWPEFQDQIEDII